MKMRTFTGIIGLLIFCFVPALSSWGQPGPKGHDPKITGQVPSPLTTPQNTPITITLDNLTVTDEDLLPIYPNGFTLELNSGDHYEFQGTTVTPDNNFTGMLKVRVRVDDGQNHSKWFDMKVEVLEAPNVAPQITGQVPITIGQGQNVTITLTQLTVTDPDNNYPADFSLTVLAGDNYTFNGNTITPSGTFTGNLTVPVSVSDGQAESNSFNLNIEVTAAQNVPPTITGQLPISINQGAGVTVALNQLLVNDPDNTYPTGFTLTVYNGNNYTVTGNTVTPWPGFSGNLKVPVSVNDGQSESNRFDLTIEVIEALNVAPTITAQTPITINQAESLTITLAQLTVTDPDDAYPGDFVLTLYGGANYTFSGTTITPSPSFSGSLNVEVSVNDGENESNRFNMTIEVKEAQNVAPEITGQTPLTINQGQTFTITLSHLVVTDPDNNYPTGFTLKVNPGNHYTVSGSAITPAANFSGQIKVPVTVNDGQNESKSFDLKIDVIKVEPVAPKITGQQTLSVNEDESITLKLADITVVDIDSQFPQDFTLKISPGSTYAVSGLNVTPAKDFFGIMSVTIRVNDGKNDSQPFELQINVLPVNDSPVITGQKKLKTDQGAPLTIALSNLTVTDPDNKYPADFTLKIAPGNNYVVAGNVISPSPAFSGLLTVIVSVNDGTVNSPDFSLQVEVISIKTNVPPTIVGQKAISITQNTSVTLQLFHLLVNDPDNQFPAGFTLKVFAGNNYIINGTTITPSANFINGTLSVRATVNDGTNDSPFFDVKIQVTPISATPRINGQKEVSMMEDSTITIKLSDLQVTDADNPGYPNGFTLKILSDGEGVYRAVGNSVTPALNFNGFIEVGVTVSDGVNTSEEFRLAILVNPVNDAPEVSALEKSPLAFEPGTDPLEIFEGLTLTDVDNDYLSMAEIGFRQTDSYSSQNDELQIDYDTSKIRAIYDPEGILFLIGYAKVEEYQSALRTIQYNYRITDGINGNSAEIMSGSRTVYINVNDGQNISQTAERQVEIDNKLALDIPTAFTPNGDNANDTWHLEISNKDRVDQAIIKVYNKRGLLLYESVAFDDEWDGTFNGQMLPVDTYYYTIVVKLPYVRQTYSGVVTILY